MKHLPLLVTEHPGRKSGKFTYQVKENGQVIYQTVSDRVYVAIILDRTTRRTADGRPGTEPIIGAAYRFGRFDLIGKGDSKNTYQSGNFYAMAVTSATEPGTDSAGSRLMVDSVNHMAFVIGHDDWIKAIELKADAPAGSHIATHDLDGNPHLVWEGDLPEIATMNLVTQYCIDPNCRPSDWIDGEDISPDQKIHFYNEIEVLGGMDKIRQARKHGANTLDLVRTYESLPLEQKENIEDLAKFGQIAQELAAHLVKIGATWEHAQPLFTAILEKKFLVITSVKTEPNE